MSEIIRWAVFYCTTALLSISEYTFLSESNTFLDRNVTHKIWYQTGLMYHKVYCSVVFRMDIVSQVT